MEKIIAHRKISEAEAEKLAGKWVEEKDIATIISTDCDVFDIHGNMLLRFRKNVIDKEVLKTAWENYSKSVSITDGRGTAAGEMFNRIRNDGSVSNIKISNKVQSGNVGYMDSSSMVHYCRMTKFAAEHIAEFKKGFEFVEMVDKLYSDLCPEHYKKQKAIANATNRNYVISNTCFTTVTVNKNFRTAIHKDSGDYPEGFGNLIIIDDGNYDGCYTCLPEFGIGVDARAGDILFIDVHHWHGNTPFKPKSENYLRGAFVLYYREYMLKCKQPSEELRQLKIDKGGFMKL